MKARILVTGGLGFIGVHLSRLLVRTRPDAHLTIVDNLSSTQLDYFDLHGLAEIVIDDMRNVGSDQTFDEIYHLASPVGSVGILGRSGTIAGDIVSLAEKAAQLAEASGARLTYVSSSEVYGRDGSHDEDSPQIVPCRRGPRMEYALGKLTAEHLLLNRARSRGLDLRIVRPFNAIGEWQSAALGFVVARFFEAALGGRSLTVFGDGRQRRAFCHVADIAAGVAAVHERGMASHIYNVGNSDNVVTIRELANTIRDLCESQSDIVLVDPVELFGPDYIEAFDKIPDTRKVKRHTGWEPEVPLPDALMRVRQHYRSGHQVPTAATR